MRFINYNELPQAVKEIIDREDYIGYVRVYFRNGRYGSRLFFKGATSGTIEEITQAEAIGRSRYTEQMRSALQTVCETLFEENNQNGKYELFDDLYITDMRKEDWQELDLDICPIGTHTDILKPKEMPVLNFILNQIEHNPTNFFFIPDNISSSKEFRRIAIERNPNLERYIKKEEEIQS